MRWLLVSCFTVTLTLCVLACCVVGVITYIGHSANATETAQFATEWQQDIVEPIQTERAATQAAK